MINPEYCSPYYTVQNDSEDMMDYSQEIFIDNDNDLYNNFSTPNEYILPSFTKRKKMFCVYKCTNGNDGSKNVDNENKRGRKNQKKIGDIHDKNGIDNIKRKIQIHCISSIINLGNAILKQLGYDLEFCDISYDIKKKITSQFTSKLKDKKLNEILSQDISGKFRNKGKNHNCKIIQSITEEVFKQFLNLKYYTYYNEIYIMDKNEIDLLNYRFLENIKLKDIELLDDLLTNQLNKHQDIDYINKIKEVACTFY